MSPLLLNKLRQNTRKKGGKKIEVKAWKCAVEGKKKKGSRVFGF